MKKLLKISGICLPFLLTTPAISQVNFDFHYGTPPPHREIIVERPYPDAVWVPGYYNIIGYRHYWVPGKWRYSGYCEIQRGHHYGRYHEDHRERGNEYRHDRSDLLGRGRMR
jgi:hypothetical protein